MLFAIVAPVSENGSPPGAPDVSQGCLSPRYLEVFFTPSHQRGFTSTGTAVSLPLTRRRMPSTDTNTCTNSINIYITLLIEGLVDHPVAPKKKTTAASYLKQVRASHKVHTSPFTLTCCGKPRKSRPCNIPYYLCFFPSREKIHPFGWLILLRCQKLKCNKILCFTSVLTAVLKPE